MKRAKKFLAVLLTSILMVMTFSIAAGADTVPVGTWSVKILVDGKSHTVTSAEAAKLTTYTVKAGYTKNGTTTSDDYTGVRLKDVLKSIGVTDVKNISTTSSDGYVMKVPYEEALAMNDNTLLAWGMDGKAMDSSHGPVMLVPGGNDTTGSQFAKMVTTITVTGATLAPTTTTTTTTTTPSTTKSTTSTTSNPKTGDSTPIAAEVILLMAMAALTTVGLRKSFSHK